ITELAQAGVKVIVTDHHELMGDVPKDAVAVVNPRRPEFRKKVLARQAEIIEGKTIADIAGLTELSGAGVAFMLARALVNNGEIPAGQEKWLLDLAMIGTICDAMKLIKDNRIICKYGMIVLKKTRRPGLKELMRVAGTKSLNADAIGFQIGPRLNAAGRMETADLALKLLTTEQKTEAARLAAELNRLNSERKEQQNQAVSEVEKQGEVKEPVLVVQGRWHEGIVGIISGRLTEKYKKPSFVLTEVDGVLKGSGRSFGEFNLALALSECQELLVSGGGHAAACGVKLKRENLEEFRRKINSYYMGLGLQNQERFLDVREDLMVTEVGELNLELLDEMKEMEPFGEGNPEPVFLLPEVFVLDASRMGAEGQHLRMLVRGEDGKTIKLVAFNAEKEWLEIKAGGRVSAWVALTGNEWNGTRSVEGRILKLGL
ncbi:single-stranded DNA exonuclease RecJ, partial [Candidatus Saccharibacteria bacterium]|nr:single-stranded DNA exonuclease RecJ [Candidatus Saccharibacteria bacterium]